MGRKNYRKNLDETGTTQTGTANEDIADTEKSSQEKKVDVNTILLVIILALLVVQTYLMITADNSPEPAGQATTEEYAPTAAPESQPSAAAPQAQQPQQITMDPNTGQVQSGGSNAVAVYSENEIDLGTLSAGNKVKHTFSVRNTGSDDLVFGDVSTDPGLLVVDGPATTIPPGGSGSITVELNTADLSGPVTKIVHVNSNSEPAHHHLEVKATVQ